MDPELAGIQAVLWYYHIFPAKDLFEDRRLMSSKAVKCNADLRLLRHLAEAGTGFDCASIREMQLVRSVGVDSSRIILANPCKAASVLCAAREMGVTKMVYDNMDELDSIKRFSPNAQLFLRIHADDEEALIHFGDKFGAPLETAPALLERAWTLGLQVIGISFHVGVLTPFSQIPMDYTDLGLTNTHEKAPEHRTSRHSSILYSEQESSSTLLPAKATLYNAST